MVNSLKRIFGFEVRAKDGSSGEVNDFIFDQDLWLNRYLIVRSGEWLKARRLVVPLVFIKNIEDRDQRLDIDLTREQLEQSPDLDLARPLRLEHQEKLQKYYGWPPYWPERGFKTPFIPSPEEAEEDVKEESPVKDKILRSCREVFGYRLRTPEGESGEVEDFLVEPDDWMIRYIVFDTRRWLPAKRVLLVPEWVDGINWEDQSFRMDLEIERIRGAPEYDPSRPLDREAEEELSEYYKKTSPEKRKKPEGSAR